jgi:hypothetical protein
MTVNDESRGQQKAVPWPNLKYYLCIFLERPRKLSKIYPIPMDDEVLWVAKYVAELHIFCN